MLVAPTTSQQAGLAAAVALAPDRTVEENAQALSDALARVRTGAVAPAARDDPHGRFTRGEAVGCVEEEVLAWGEPFDSPLWEGRTDPGQADRAFVCRDYACQAPTGDAEVLASQLDT